ncbi:uncharacterized protein METZ01_LOCUS271836 [marine metagenome]|uniref:Uncharacterized protein n=1 Tax=marine metagenome TaxID=408172 RepID=A0A382K6E4_9ZZZZ
MGYKRMNATTSFYSIVFVLGLIVVLGYSILYSLLVKFNTTNYKGSKYTGVGYGYRDLNDREKYV